MDSCLIKDSLVTQNVEEAYRFEYWSFMCPYNTRLEIRKYPDSISVVITIYQYAWHEQPCVLKEKIRKTISNEEWKEFQEKMESADFWGLKNHNDISGTDGSDIEIHGFKKGLPPRFPNQKHYVYRWSPEMSSIMNPVYFLVKLCKIKQGCLRSE